MKRFTLDELYMQTSRINELMEKAEEELYAVDNLVDLSAADWIVGFHCQQIAEKTLKAVLISKGQTPAMTHDLVLLMNEVRQAGIAEPTWFWELENLNPFAVQLRYETLNTVADFSAAYARVLTRRAYGWAERELGWAQEDSRGPGDDEDQDGDKQLTNEAVSEVPEFDPETPI